MTDRKGFRAIPPNARALTALGDQTLEAVEELLSIDTTLFGVKDDAEFKTLADAFRLREWTDEPASRVLREFASVKQNGKTRRLSQLVGWVRAHGPDAADQVIECIKVDPPSEVEVLSVLSERGSQKMVFLASWQGRRDVVLKRVIGEEDLISRLRVREGFPHPFSLTHPNVIQTWQLTNTDDEVFFVESRLDAVLRDRTDLGALQNVVTLLLDVANALQYVHEHGWVHGDVKPDNIGRRGDNYVLLDFGISRPFQEFTNETTPTGTLRTRPPELLLNEQIYPAKLDVWALGATVFNFLVGRFPLIERDEDVPRKSSPADREEFEQVVAHRVAHEWQKWLNFDLVPEPIRSVISRMLTRRPEDRAELTDVVSHVQNDLSMFIPSRTPRPRAARKLLPKAELAQVETFLSVAGDVSELPRHRKDGLISKLNGLRYAAELTPADVLRIEEIVRVLR